MSEYLCLLGLHWTGLTVLNGFSFAVIFTLRAICGAVYCNRSCLPVCGFVAVFVSLLPRQLEIACIDPHQTEFVGKSSDYLQLINFF